MGIFGFGGDATPADTTTTTPADTTTTTPADTTTTAPAEFVFPPEGEGDYFPPDASCPTVRARYDEQYKLTKQGTTQ